MAHPIFYVRDLWDIIGTYCVGEPENVRVLNELKEQIDDWKTDTWRCCFSDWFIWLSPSFRLVKLRERMRLTRIWRDALK